MHAFKRLSCPEQGANLLGWIGLGIGLTEVLAPRQVQSMLGLKPTPHVDGALRARFARNDARA